MQQGGCQLCGVTKMGMVGGPWDLLRQGGHRLKRMVGRRVRYLQALVLRRRGGRDPLTHDRAPAPMKAGLKPGDRVRIRSRDEIASTLDGWNQLKHCAFMEEMWPYCGTTQTVFKRVGTFLDERDYRVKTCSGTIILNGVLCEGTRDFGPCDRSCYFFWREEWVEPLPDAGDQGRER